MSSQKQDTNKAAPQPNGRPAEPAVSQAEDIGSFRVTEQGLYRLQELPTNDGEELKRDWTWISAPIKALGLATDQYGKNSSIVVEFGDTHGRTKTHVLPRATFAGQSGEQVVRQLLDEGLTMSSSKGAPSLIRQYLMQCRPPVRYLLVQKPGWYGRVFALPDCAFGEQGNTESCSTRTRRHSSFLGPAAHSRIGLARSGLMREATAGSCLALARLLWRRCCN